MQWDYVMNMTSRDIKTNAGWREWHWSSSHKSTCQEVGLNSQKVKLMCWKQKEEKKKCQDLSDFDKGDCRVRTERQVLGVVFPVCRGWYQKWSNWRTTSERTVTGSWAPRAHWCVQEAKGQPLISLKSYCSTNCWKSLAVIERCQYTQRQYWVYPVGSKFTSLLHGNSSPWWQWPLIAASWTLSHCTKTV